MRSRSVVVALFSTGCYLAHGHPDDAPTTMRDDVPCEPSVVASDHRAFRTRREIWRAPNPLWYGNLAWSPSDRTLAATVGNALDAGALLILQDDGCPAPVPTTLTWAPAHPARWTRDGGRILVIGPYERATRFDVSGDMVTGSALLLDSLVGRGNIPVSGGVFLFTLRADDGEPTLNAFSATTEAIVHTSSAPIGSRLATGLDVSADGRLVAFGHLARDTNLGVVDLFAFDPGEGFRLLTSIEPGIRGFGRHVDLTPNGRRLLTGPLGVVGGRDEDRLFVVDLDSGAMVTSAPISSATEVPWPLDPEISADGRTVVSVRCRNTDVMFEEVCAVYAYAVGEASIEPAWELRPIRDGVELCVLHATLASDGRLAVIAADTCVGDGAVSDAVVYIYEP